MLLEKWDQAIFPHLCRSDGKGGRGAQVGGICADYWCLLASSTDRQQEMEL